jgi:hypothetical protein
MAYVRATSFPPALRGHWSTIAQSHRQREPFLSQDNMTAPADQECLPEGPVIPDIRWIVRHT